MIDNTKIGSKTIPEYSWIKFLSNAILILPKSNIISKKCLLYQFDVVNNIVNFHEDIQAILLDKLPPNFPSEKIFFYEDVRQIKDNFIIYFYTAEKAYAYNSLNPIISQTPLKYYSFNTNSQLLLKPQMIHN
jgi:hypothetical protein